MPNTERTPTMAINDGSMHASVEPPVTPMIRISSLPVRISDREAWMRATRAVLGETSTQFATRLGLTRHQYNRFEIGQSAITPDVADAFIGALGEEERLVGHPVAEATIAHLTAINMTADQRASLQASGFLPPFDGEVIFGFKDKEPEAEKNKWDQTIARAGTLRTAMHYLHMGSRMTTAEIAEEAGVSEIVIKNARRGKTIKLSSANKLIDMFGLEPDSLGAQLFRLMSQGIEPKSTDSFRGASRGEMMLYFRVAQGQSQEEAAQKLHISQSAYAKQELDRVRPISNMDNLLLDWVGATPGTPFADALLLMFREEEITTEQAQALQNSGYATAEVQQEAARISSRKSREITRIKAASLGGYLRARREERGESQESLAAKVYGGKVEGTEVSTFERGVTIPTDVMLLDLSDALGFEGIHDPRTQALFKKAEEERKVRDRTRAGSVDVTDPVGGGIESPDKGASGQEVFDATIAGETGEPDDVLFTGNDQGGGVVYPGTQPPGNEGVIRTRREYPTEERER